MQRKMKYLLVIIGVIILIRVLLHMFLTPEIYFNTFRIIDFNKAKNIISKIEKYKTEKGVLPERLEDVGEISGENGGKFYYGIIFRDKKKSKFIEKKILKRTRLLSIIL